MGDWPSMVSRRIVPLLPLLLAAAATGLVFAKGEGAGAAGKRVQRSATAGPGYIQDQFFGGFRKALDKGVGRRRAERFLDRLAASKLERDDVLGLVNGRIERDRFRPWFGVDRRDERRDIETALGTAVEEKDRRILFGVLLRALIRDFDVDPTSEFVRQVVRSRDAMSEDDFRAILRGSWAKSTIGDAFGLRSRRDQDFMQDVLKRVWEQPYFTHPMASSLGRRMGGARRDKFDPKAFPALAQGMPGAEPEYAAGKAAGFPFDLALPACPFAGPEVDEYYKELDAD